MMSGLEYTSWPIENQVELDALEDLFKQKDKKPALKPALSTIVGPAQCNIYDTFGRTTNFPNERSISSGTEDDQCTLSRDETVTKELFPIELNVVDADTEKKQPYEVPLLTFRGIAFQNETQDSSAESHLLDRLYPPVANLASGKEIFEGCNNDKTINVFVSGTEAERQKKELKEFGFKVALTLAERRARYNRRQSNQRKEEQLYIQSKIENEIKCKKMQLKMADELEMEGTPFAIRRAKLWRRCANMAEALVREESETFLWQKRYEEAAAVVYGNKNMF